MNSLIFWVFILSINIKNGLALLEGHETSLVYLSNTTYFNYKSMNNLILFGDSLSTVNTKFINITNKDINSLEGKGEKWPIQLSKLNNMRLWDFAVAGSVIDKKFFTSGDQKNIPYSFIDQYDHFMDQMSKGKKYEKEWNSNNTLFAYWIGTNDIFIIDQDKYRYKLNRTIDSMVNTLFDTLEGTYDTGARNFLFINLQALEDLPRVNETDKNDMKSNTVRFNNCLYKESLDFYGRHNDTNVIIYNMKDEFLYITNNYEEYDFTINNDTYNSHKDKNPDMEDYIWLDDIHGTPKTNEILAKNINLLLTENENSAFQLYFNITFSLLNILLVLYLIL